MSLTYPCLCQAFQSHWLFSTEKRLYCTDRVKISPDENYVVIWRFHMALTPEPYINKLLANIRQRLRTLLPLYNAITTISKSPTTENAASVPNTNRHVKGWWPSWSATCNKQEKTPPFAVWFYINCLHPITYCSMKLKVFWNHAQIVVISHDTLSIYSIYVCDISTSVFN